MSQNVQLPGNLDMLHSLYDFTATYAKTLSFKSNQFFILHQTITKHKNWWEVINENGDIGFIPSNYVEIVTVNPIFLYSFVKNCLEKLKRKSSTSIDERTSEIVGKLNELKGHLLQLPEIAGGDHLEKLTTKNSDPIRKNLTAESSLISELKKAEIQQIDEPPIQPIQKQHNRYIRKSIDDELNALKHDNGQETTTTTTTTTTSPITHQSVFDLVESVRINTQLSHEMSRVALVTVIQGLHELLPANVFPHLSTILSYVQTSLNVDDVQIEQTHDASRLKIIFTELTTCKEDSQQRSWMLHEDEDVIKDYLLELISILSNADVSISKHVISSDQYHSITTLIQYYQMEIRWSIRQLLLQTFGVLCSLDKTVVSIMLNSILPGELARDMMANPRNIPKLNYSSILLTMIFSMGEPMPVTHNELVGNKFLSFLLDNIEYPPDTDVDEQIPDLFLNCILSYNLQFVNYNENPLLDTLEERDVAKTFTEKILLLFNREYDPVRVFEHTPAPPHSLLKLFLDLLSRKTTANLFYTNDIKVLIDIIVRNISDLSPGDKRRQQYLELCRRLMRNTNYNEHRHRIDDILKCFTRIFCEETENSRTDQKLVRAISQEFPQFFK